MSRKESDVVLNFRTNGEVQFLNTIKNTETIMNNAAKQHRNSVNAMDKNATATDKLRLKQQTLTTQLDAARQRTAEYRKEQELLPQKLEKATAKTQDFKTKLEESKIKLAENVTKHKELSDAYARSVQDSGRMSDETIRLKNELDHSKMALKDSTAETKNLQREYNESSKTVKGTASELEKLPGKLLDAENAEITLSKTLKETNEEMKKQAIFSDELKKKLDTMGKVGDGFTNVGKKLSLIVTAPAAAMTAGLIKNGIEVRKFRAQAQLYYEGLYQDTGKAKQQLDDLMTFAKTTPYSYESIVEADQIMQTFGMTTSKSAKVLEALANTIASTGGSSADLAQLGTVMGQIESSGKLSLQDMNQLINAKIPALKIVGNELGLSVTDLRTAISKGKISSESAINALTKGLMQGTDGMNGATQAYAGALGNVKQQLPGAIDSMKSAFKNLSLALVSEDMFAKLIETINKITAMVNSGALMPVIENIGNALSDVLDVVIKVAEWFTNLSPGMQQMIVKVIAFTALLGPILILIGKTIKIVSLLAKAFKVAQLALGLLNIPMLLVIAAIAAVIAIGVLLYKNWDQIKVAAANMGEAIGAMWTDIKQWFSDSVAYIKQLWDSTLVWWNKLWFDIGETVSKLINVIKDGWQKFLVWWVELGKGIGKFFTDIWVKAVEIWTKLRESTTQIWNNIVDVVKTILGTLVKIIMVPVSLITTIFSGLWLLLKAGFEIAWEAIKIATEFIWNGIVNFLSTLWEGLKIVAQTTWDLISKFIISPIQAAWSFIVEKFTELKAWLEVKWGEIKEVAARLWQGIKETIINPIIEVFNTVLRYLTNLWNGFIEICSKIKNSALEIWTNIKSVIVDVWNSTKQTVLDTANQLWSGTKNIFNDIWTGTKSIFKRIGEAIVAPIIMAKDKIKETINSIKDFFMNIKFPKFGLKMASKTILGKEISYPSGIDVKWNAKGAIFKKAVVAGNYNGVPQGFGEAGPEAAIPLNEENLGAIGRGIAATMGGKVEQHIHFGKLNTGSMSEISELNRNIRRSSDLSDFALGGGI